MLLTLYRGLSAVSEPVWRLALGRRLRKGREDPDRVAEKFGESRVPRPAGFVLWVNALSVGESLALLSLLRVLRAERPDVTILLTTSTRASAMALEQVGLPKGVIHQYAPIDAPGPVRRFLTYWAPCAAVFSELDLWPTRMLKTQATGIPMILINARISEKRSRSRSRARSVYAALLSPLRRVLVEDAASVGRFEALGMAKDRIRVAGVLKSAADPLPADAAQLATLRAAVGDRPVWLAASTERREVARILDAHAALRVNHPDLLLIIAPRQLAEADEATALATARFATARRSAGALPGPETAVYIADTIGEMGLWFRVSPISFVGHSLPVDGDPLPGKNPFEPAALGSAILYGPDHWYFTESYDAFDAAGGALRVLDAQGLAAGVNMLLNPGACAAQTAAATATLTHARAPLEVTLQEVLAILPPPVAPQSDKGSS
ncbi:MAG: glycosyltransferase N-terminal domain-containing protein [Gemmobacter sp.]|nr:glycosyltransferase N-terminal domain-containing protein [Gemmobacter sp.]